MNDRLCVEFLQRTLPRAGLRWEGFRRVRNIVCKRLGRRLRELSLGDLDAYRAYLDAHPEEWDEFAELCRIPISRFFRDRAVFGLLCDVVLPDLARHALASATGEVRCWSAGCASGEEPYTLAIAWRLGAVAALAPPPLRIVATDASPQMIERALHGCYERGSFHDLPGAWLSAALEPVGAELAVRDEFRTGIQFVLQDLRAAQPDGPFDLVLCRNTAFTYFDEVAQREALARMLERLRPGGVLVIGHKEDLPTGDHGLMPIDAKLRVFRRSRSDAGDTARAR